MRKDLFFQIVVMLIALAIASAIAPVLQKKQFQINPDKGRLTKAPVGGFHKIFSDFEWMRFVNYLGRQASVDEKNVKEVISWLERLQDLDPKFDRLYLDGVSSIQHADPKKTLEILENACSVEHLKSNWKIPFYTGFVYSRTSYDIHDQNLIRFEANHQKAADYFKMAIQRSGEKAETFVYNNYIRELAKAEARGTLPDREQLAKLKILYRMWKSSEDCGGKSFSPVHSGKEIEIVVPNIQGRLLKAIQESKNMYDLDDHKIEPSAETAALIEKIKKEVLYDRHLCEKCLKPANPGDKFCTSCGFKFKTVYGICPSCRRLINPGSKFCGACGSKLVRTELPADK